MAARLNRRHQDSVRERIKVVNIITRLQKHIDGEIDMSPTQVTSARILLDKSISNAATDLNVSGNVTIHWPEPRNALDE